MVLNFHILSAFKNERNCCTGNSTNLGFLTTTCYIYTRRSYFALVIFLFSMPKWQYYDNEYGTLCVYPAIQAKSP